MFICFQFISLTGCLIRQTIKKHHQRTNLHKRKVYNAIEEAKYVSTWKLKFIFFFLTLPFTLETLATLALKNMRHTWNHVHSSCKQLISIYITLKLEPNHLWLIIAITVCWLYSKECSKCWKFKVVLRQLHNYKIWYFPVGVLNYAKQKFLTTK